MNKKMITVAIGDVHGLTNWQNIVEQHPEDKIVFLGDYCDPYGYIEDEDVVDNLWNILSFKKMNPGRVVLLLGNHDMHYIFDEEKFVQGTRFNPDLEETLHKLFTDNLEFFQYAYQDGEYLYTHAGLSAEWFRDDFGWKEKVTKESLAEIENALNHPTEEQFEAMAQVGMMRGGWNKNGGIFWADICEVSLPVTGLKQIVGHNQVDRPRTLSIDEKTSITFCDCLRYDEYLKIG